MGEVLQKGTVCSQPKFLRKQPSFAHPTSRTDVLQVLMPLGNALVQRVVRRIRQYISFDMAPEVIHGIQLDMQQATTVMQYRDALRRIWPLPLYGKMPCPRIRQYSSPSTRSASYARVFEIPLGYIDLCHGSVHYPANSSCHRVCVFYDHRYSVQQLGCLAVPISLVRAGWRSGWFQP